MSSASEDIKEKDKRLLEGVIQKKKKQQKGIKPLVNKAVQGDCLNILPSTPGRFVDIVPCDLPYDTTQNKRDLVIDLRALWTEYEHIVKGNGAAVLTVQGIFTAESILSREKLFGYKITWIKSKPTNFLNTKRQPFHKHENVCIFYKKQPVHNPQMTKGEAYDKGIRKDQYIGSYGEFKPQHVKSDDECYPNDMVFFEEDHDNFVHVKTVKSKSGVYHPTQKPVELGRHLIRAFSNPGDIISDNARDSGSFLLSVILENRSFIGIEKNKDVLLHRIQPTDYIKTCMNRISETLKREEMTPSTHKLFRKPITKYHTLNYLETDAIS